MENLESGSEIPENEKEQSLEGILDMLEVAFESGSVAELTVLEPNGELKTNSVFIEGLENGMLFVSESKSAPVMGIDLGAVKKVK